MQEDKLGFKAIKQRTMKSFGYEWTQFSHLVPQYETWFLRCIAPLTPDSFCGKLVLDAGCGMGRHMYYASKYGAEVVGIDLSSAVYAARDNLRNRSNAHVLRADVYRLPLRSGFDLIYSIGVLHHLPEPQDAVGKLRNLLKPGGKLLLWVYAKEGNQFAIKFMEPARRITTRLPFHALEALSGILSGILFGLCRLSHLLKSVSILKQIPYFLYFTRLSDFGLAELRGLVFDILSASLAKYVSSDELRGWCANAGLVIDSLRWVNRNGWTIVCTTG